MTDIITQAEQVIIDHTSDDVSYGELAQALADAGLLAQPTRTVPTRDEIVDVILDTHLFDGGTPIDTADAILALLAGQPTVAEVKARALEEAATEIKAQTLEEVAHVLAEQEHFTKKTQGAKELKDRAQQIRDRE